MRVRASCVAVLLVAIATGTPALAAPRIHFVLSDTAAAYDAVADAAEAALDGGVTSRSHAGDDDVPADAEIIVAVGTAAAARWAASDDPRPVFVTLVPAATWHALVPSARENRSAVYLDQPLARQLALARVLLPPMREVGVVLGPGSTTLESELTAAAARHGIAVNVHRAAADAEINGAVVGVLRSSEALIALPDPSVYNRYNVQSVLLASFRLRRPVVAYSESWVRAGALAALHSTPTQLGTEIGGVIAAWLGPRGPLPASRPPADYTLTVNRQVGFSLGLDLPPDAVLLQRLRLLLESS